MITQHFKTPQDAIHDYYYQKRLESVTPQKPTKLLTFGRGSNKRLLRDLYLEEIRVESYFAEITRKNYHYYIGRDNK